MTRKGLERLDKDLKPIQCIYRPVMTRKWLEILDKDLKPIQCNSRHVMTQKELERLDKDLKQFRKAQTCNDSKRNRKTR